MLVVTNHPAVGSVVSIIIPNHHIIATLVNETDDSYTISKPLELSGLTQGIATFKQYIPLADITKNVVIFKHSITAIGYTSQLLVDQYNLN